ncbi:hypothetical protein PtA15_12A396 [Puccinia triticina]|uniref:Uncharacterized protein n=1 Tax=Puccinia triticina TaxID=208348 RepID=A0ABY7D2C3_9BASI|nr:uncharacterized protein PtA15_12A396 [Puccinia triticina]WAQ90407.1 hypothetical protein PtA15_12A396 [Puccinia triticina]
MIHRDCALLLLSVWALGQVSCNDLNPIDRAGRSFDILPLSRPENHEREDFSNAEPLSLFPISAGETKDDRNRAQAQVPTSPGPLLTLGGYHADEYREDLSANNEQSTPDHELLSLFPLAPGGARADHEQHWDILPGREGLVPNSPGPTNSDSPSFLRLATRFDEARPNSPTHKENREGTRSVSRNDLQTAPPMDVIAEKPLSDSEKTMHVHHSDSRSEQEEVSYSSPQVLAEGGHVSNNPGPTNTGSREEPQPEAIVAPGERLNSRKRVRESLSEEDHVQNRPRLSDSPEDGHRQDLSRDDREQPALDVASTSFPSSTTRLDAARDSPTHEEPGGPVSQNNLQTAPPIVVIDETSSSSEETRPNPQSGPSSTSKTRNEPEKVSDKSLAAGGHGPNSPGPIITSTRDKPQPEVIVVSEEGTSSRKRLWEIISKERYLLEQLRDIRLLKSKALLEERWVRRRRRRFPGLDGSRRSPSSTSRPGRARLDLPNPEEPGSVFRNNVQTAAPMDLTAVNSLRHSPKTTSNAQSSSPPIPKTKRERVEVSSSSLQILERIIKASSTMDPTDD